MEFVDRADDRPEPISITRCRELLGQEADAMTDQEVALIRRHAETMVGSWSRCTRNAAESLSRDRASTTRFDRALRWI